MLFKTNHKNLSEESEDVAILAQLIDEIHEIGKQFVSHSRCLIMQGRLADAPNNDDLDWFPYPSKFLNDKVKCDDSIDELAELEEIR